jgi:cytochrome c553
MGELRLQLLRGLLQGHGVPLPAAKLVPNVQRPIHAGDPKRGIAACASCHGPGGYRIVPPALTNQNALYMEQQLQAFAQGTRANDVDMPMRTIAGMLTPPDMKALAFAYSNGLKEFEVRIRGRSRI